MKEEVEDCDVRGASPGWGELSEARVPLWDKGRDTAVLQFLAGGPATTLGHFVCSREAVCCWGLRWGFPPVPEHCGAVQPSNQRVDLRG